MKYSLIAMFVFMQFAVVAQDRSFAIKVVDTLTSPYFWGRGYTNDGMDKAAKYLADQFSSFNIQPVNGQSYYQHFSFPVNTFPAKMEVKINGKLLQSGIDYIVSPESRGVHASTNLSASDSTHFVNPNYRIIVSLEDKLTWSVADKAADYTLIQVNKKSLGEIPTHVQADIDNKEVNSFKTSNVCGWVKGTEHPDSIIVFSAHYDHLGGMGSNTFFPGANDNASGTALLLGLAKYYGSHPQPYTIAFISFAGEEAGLIGSKYFIDHPLYPLQNIRFLLNLDLEGTGTDGITVVNATEYEKEFKMLNQVNDSLHLLSTINARGKAANSDHYWFSEKGVPAFFFYTLGGIQAYHDVFDKAATLPLNEYEDLITLVKGFTTKLQQ